MKGINHLFEKFKSIAVKEVQNRTLISEVIKKVIGQDIPIKNISFCGKMIKIKTSSATKNQIFIKKQTLLKLLQERINIDDIQ